MSPDPLSARTLASVFAVGGLCTMMTASEPNWHAVGIGLACLLAFGGLWLVPVRRPARRRLIATRFPHRVVRAIEILPASDPPPLALPAPGGPDDPHAAAFHGTRTRRSVRSP